MNVPLLKQICAVPTQTFKEDQMVSFLTSLVNSDNGRYGHCYADEHKNVFISKGNRKHKPCVAAHIDSVQPIRDVQILEHGGVLTAVRNRKQVGFGADDKTGIFVCLELLQEFDNIAVAFFAAEELGCQGAAKADLSFFDGMGYMLEFDCPSRSLMSYTSSGTRLFENNGEFIQRALPTLQKHKVEWQNHPYTDVMKVRHRTSLSCMNLASGYYNWHSSTEYIRLSDVQDAIDMAEELIPEIGWRRFDFTPSAEDKASQPLMEIKPLRVVDVLG